MYSDFAVNKYLHTVASGWIFINTVTWSHSTYFGKPKTTAVPKSFGEHIKHIDHNLVFFFVAMDTTGNCDSATVNIAYLRSLDFRSGANVPPSHKLVRPQCWYS